MGVGCADIKIGTGADQHQLQGPLSANVLSGVRPGYRSLEAEESKRYKSFPHVLAHKSHNLPMHYLLYRRYNFGGLFNNYFRPSSRSLPARRIWL